MSATFANKNSLLDPCGLSNKPKPERPYVLATDQFGVSYRLYSKDRLGELLAHVKEALALEHNANASYRNFKKPSDIKVRVAALLSGKQTIGYKLELQSFVLRHVEAQVR